MSDEQTSPPPAAAHPAAPPTNSAEASARLGALSADKAWSDKLLAGDPYAAKEFSDLHVMIDAGDKVDSAMAGIVPDVPDSGHRLMTEVATWLREAGISDGAVRQTLSDYEVTQQEFDAVQVWKGQRMRSPEFVKQYLSGEPDFVKQMTLANIVLSSNIKREVTA